MAGRDYGCSPKSAISLHCGRTLLGPEITDQVVLFVSCSMLSERDVKYRMSPAYGNQCPWTTTLHTSCSSKHRHFHELTSAWKFRCPSDQRRFLGLALGTLHANPLKCRPDLARRRRHVCYASQSSTAPVLSLAMRSRRTAPHAFTRCQRRLGCTSARDILDTGYRA